MKTRNKLMTVILIIMSGLILGMTNTGCNKSNEENPSPQIPTGDVTVAKINQNPEAYLGQTVTLKGYIVALISDDDFWFKDASEGEIRTDFPDSNLPKVGDQVTITGRVKYDDGKLEIEVNSWQGETPTGPPSFTFDKISDIKANSGEYLYQLVALQGTVTSKADDDDDEFYFSDGTGEIKLDFPDSGNAPTVGQQIITIGNLTQDDNALEVNVTYWE